MCPFVFQGGGTRACQMWSVLAPRGGPHRAARLLPGEEHTHPGVPGLQTLLPRALQHTGEWRHQGRCKWGAKAESEGGSPPANVLVSVGAVLTTALLQFLKLQCFSFRQSGERREVCHYLYVSWPDFGVPKSASAMLDFREHVLQRRDAAVQSLGTSWTGPPGGPPVVVHCSAGIGRTGMHLWF